MLDFEYIESVGPNALPDGISKAPRGTLDIKVVRTRGKCGDDCGIYFKTRGATEWVPIMLEDVGCLMAKLCHNEGRDYLQPRFEGGRKPFNYVRDLMRHGFSKANELHKLGEFHPHKGKLVQTRERAA